MISCLDDDTLLRLGRAELHGDAAAAVDEHLDACPACRRVLAELARVQSQRGPAELELLPEPGARLSRYVLLDPVGVGAMGVVWAAYDPKLDRKVALKLLRAREELASMTTRLQREAQAMARVRHPHVVAVHDVGVHHDQPWVAMEFVAGPSLRAWLAEKPRAPHEVLALMLGAGRGLAAAHARGVVHRDFKPDNVLVDEGGEARVTDFGLASARNDSVASGLDAPLELATLTRTGALMGTPPYMAPELIDGESADARSDQFAFCVSLYEALCGHRPHSGATLRELAAAARSTPSWESRSFTPKVRVALARGLSPDPQRRFASMEELLAALAPERPRGRGVGAAIALGLLLAAGAAVWQLRARACDGERWVAEVWTEAARTSAGAERDTLERWAATLAALRSSACSAAERGADPLQARRATCLEARRQELAAWIEAPLSPRPLGFPADAALCSAPSLLAYDGDAALEAELARAGWAVTRGRPAAAAQLAARAKAAGLEGATRRSELLAAREALNEARHSAAARLAAEVTLASARADDGATRVAALEVLVRAVLSEHPRAYPYPSTGERSSPAMEHGLARWIQSGEECHADVRRRRAAGDYRPLYQVMSGFDDSNAADSAAACSWVGYISLEEAGGWGDLWNLYDGLKSLPLAQGLTEESEARWLAWLEASKPAKPER